MGLNNDTAESAENAVICDYFPTAVSQSLKPTHDANSTFETISTPDQDTVYARLESGVLKIDTSVTVVTFGEGCLLRMICIGWAVQG